MHTARLARTSTGSGGVLGWRHADPDNHPPIRRRPDRGEAVGVGDWLARRSMADLDKWAKANPSYEDLRVQRSDKEYLFYINHKLGYTNKLLDGIKILFAWIGIVLFMIGLKLFGWF